MHNAREGEWEPGGALREFLEGMPLQPGPKWDDHLARLRPLLEGALEELRRPGRRRGLYREERATEEALRTLLAASKASESRSPRVGGDVPPGTRALR